MDPDVVVGVRAPAFGRSLKTTEQAGDHRVLWPGREATQATEAICSL